MLFFKKEKKALPKKGMAEAQGVVQREEKRDQIKGKREKPQNQKITACVPKRRRNMPLPQKEEWSHGRPTTTHV